MTSKNHKRFVSRTWPGPLLAAAESLSCNRELKQTDAAAANLQISIQKNSRPSEFSRPLTSITLNLNRDLPVDRRRVSLLKLPNMGDSRGSASYVIGCHTRLLIFSPISS